MYFNFSVNLGNLLLSLSDATELASPAIASHQMRSAYIALKLAKIAKLSVESTESLYIASLLHDIGALSPEEKICIHNFEDKNAQVHCYRGETLLNLSSLLKPASTIVKHHHRTWKDWKESISSNIVLESQILFLAEILERYIDRNEYILHQHEHLVSKIISLSNVQIHSDVIDLFVTISKCEDFWLDLMSPRLYSLLLQNGPYRRLEVDMETVKDIGMVFRAIIDFRSPFTSTHSAGVSECAFNLGKIFGLTEFEISLLAIAGNFHDIGKLAVPNSILEKPGKLTTQEFAVVKQHTYFTYSILNTIGGLKQICEWAAFHHETLEGTGYPFHCPATRIDIGSRIMAVADIFTALQEKRPYRQGMNRQQVEEILKNLSNKTLDSRIVNLLLDNYDEILIGVKEKQSQASDFYRQLFRPSF
jgi:HD-GYP domain-containing protein (c-di-GMP phosphodiesterase class II)